MLRNVLGIIAGAVLCNFGFLALAFGLAQLWPAYGVHGRTYLQQRLFTFPAPMAACTLLLWVAAALAAGFVAIENHPNVAWRAGAGRADRRLCCDHSPHPRVAPVPVVVQRRCCSADGAGRFAGRAERAVAGKP